MDHLLMGTVYESDRAAVFCGLAEEALPRLAKDSVDLVVTDPPYGQKFLSSYRVESFDPIVGDDGTLNLGALVGLMLPGLRQQRHLYIFGPAVDLSALPLVGPAELVWNKGQLAMGDLTSPWSKSWEPIQFYVYRPSAAHRRNGQGRLAARLRQGSVLNYQRMIGGTHKHPAEKPVSLMRCLIEASSLPGETVLDPFAGSGSTLVAAILAGRRGIGVECDKQYVDLMVERVRAAEKVADSMEGL